MHNFFSFKNYVGYGAGKLAAFKDELARQKEVVTNADPQHVLNEAWQRRFTNLNDDVPSHELKAAMAWRVYSAPADTVMFVYGSVGSQVCMFVHTVHRQSNVTKMLARYFDFFVACHDDDGDVRLLSAFEWETLRSQGDVALANGFIVGGSLPVELLRRTVDLKKMPRGYYDARYRRECMEIMTELHTSRYLINKIIRQSYSGKEEQESTVFTFDKYPHLRTPADMQRLPRALCLVYAAHYGVEGMMRALPKAESAVTPIFADYVRTYRVDGKEMDIESVLKMHFASDDALPLLNELIRSDADQRVPSEIYRIAEETKLLYEGVSDGNIFRGSPYVAAACLVFLVRIEDDPRTFEHLSFEEWLSRVTYEDFALSVARLVTNQQSAAGNIFRHFLWNAHVANSILRSWYLTTGQPYIKRHPSLLNLPEQYDLLRAPASSLFSVKHEAHKHVVSLSAHIFTVLGVRITDFASEGPEDVLEKSIAACIEASVVMEVLFPRTKAISGLLVDCRLWIAAWLFTFKIIIDRRVRSDKIAALLWTLKNHDLRATNSEKDRALFARLFHFSSEAYVPCSVGALIPTLADIRKYVDIHAAPTPPINFDNVHDVRADTLHWPADETTLGDYERTAIKYSADVSASDYGSIMYGDQRVSLERVGESLRRVFFAFFGTEEDATATRLALKKLNSTAGKKNEPYGFTIRQLADGDRRIAFDLVKARSPKRLKLAVVHAAAKKHLQRRIDSLSEEDLMHVAWFAHSDLMKEAKREREVAYSASIVHAYSSDPLTNANYAAQLAGIYAAMQNPALSDRMAIYDMHARQTLSVRGTTEAALNVEGGVDAVDVPLSFGGKVLAKQGQSTHRYLEGFPAEFRSDDEKLIRLYNAYADVVCHCRQVSRREVNDELFEQMFETLAYQYENKFKLPASIKGSSKQEKFYFGHYTSRMRKKDDTTNSWCLARDVYAVLSASNSLLRIPDEVFFTRQTYQAGTPLGDYCSTEVVPISVEAVSNLHEDTSRDKSVFALSRYGASHYFKFAGVINSEKLATLLLRMLAADDYRQFDFYAPIAAYVHSSLAGRVELTGDSLYRRVGDYLTSRRGLTPALHQASGFTGYAPVVDAYTQSAGIHQLKAAVQAPVGCAVGKHPVSNEFLLTRTADEAQDGFGILAAEVTRVEFTAYITTRTHVDAQKLLAEKFAQDVSTAIFNVEELYPVDEYTWFQFVEAVPGPPISSSALRPVDVVGNLTKRGRQLEKSSRKQKARIEAQIAEEPLNEEYSERRRRFEMLRLRISTYKNLKHDASDPNFRRDFVDFYVRHILVNIPNTDDVYVGSTDDYATFVRYYGTPVESYRSAEDKLAVDAFLQREEDVRILLSGSFPRWRVVVFGRSANTVLVARPHQFGADDDIFSAVVPGAVYAQISVLSGDEQIYNFFAMLRFVQVLLRRASSERLRAQLSEEEKTFVDAGVLDYFSMLDVALGAIAGVELSEDLDWRDKMTVQSGISEQDRQALMSTGTRGYLSDEVLQWYSSWLNLTYAKDNPMPRRLFEIESTHLSTLLLAKQRTGLKQKPRPTAELHFYPWYDAKRKHFYLIFVHFPTMTAVAIDSLFVRDDAAIRNHVAAIADYYASTKSVPLSQWTIVNLLTNLPMQRTAYQCGDYTMANIEYLVKWITGNKKDFEDVIESIGITRTLYSEEQRQEVSDLAESFRARVLQLAASVEQSPAASSSPITVSDDEDEIVVLTEEDEATVANPSVDYEAREDVPPSTSHVYPTCIIRGYEINAQRFGNQLRYVRYGQQSNVEFARVPRTSLNYTEEAALAYWRLRETSQVESGAELVARMPPGDIWRRLLLTGFPYSIQPRTKSNSKVADASAIGPTMSVGARLLPLAERHVGVDRLAASPLPIYKPRTVGDSIIG